MAEKTQLNIRISQAQKKEWEDYIEETGAYNTLTGLIRGAVHSEMNESPDVEQSGSPAFQTDIQQLREDVEDIKSDVNWLRHREQSDDSIEDLAQEVYSSLVTLNPVQGSLDVPSDVNEKEARYKMAAQNEIEPNSAVDAAEQGKTKHTKQAIAERVDADPDDVEDAIDYLQERLMPVISVEYRGSTHYFKED